MIASEFIPDSAQPGTGGKSILSVARKVVAEGHSLKTQPYISSADEGANAFTGKIIRVIVAQQLPNAAAS